MPTTHIVAHAYIHRPAVWVMAVLLATVATTGCTDDQPKTYPVHGRVVYPDGTPVSDPVTVGFRTTIDGIEYVASGVTSDDGRFELTTFLPNDGAVAGTHAVSVGWVPLGEVITRTSPIADKYTSEETSGLTATVGADDDNAIVLTVIDPAGARK